MKDVLKSITINATPELVYQAYTLPAQIQFWYHSRAQIALRPQGHFTLASATGDVFECGEYLEVKANELLRYTFEHHGYCRNSEVEVRFVGKENGQQTEVQVSHRNLNEGDWQHMNMSLDWSLKNLKDYLEEGRSQTFKAWFAKHKPNYPDLP